MASESKERVRAQKRLILAHLERGPACLADLARVADAEEREARAILMRLIRHDVVRNVGGGAGGEATYELWSDTIRRLRAKQLPDRTGWGSQGESAVGARRVA